MLDFSVGYDDKTLEVAAARFLGLKIDNRHLVYFGCFHSIVSYRIIFWKNST
jgi:hypothetical protein